MFKKRYKQVNFPAYEMRGKSAGVLTIWPPPNPRSNFDIVKYTKRSAAISCLQKGAGCKAARLQNQRRRLGVV